MVRNQRILLDSTKNDFAVFIFKQGGLGLNEMTEASGRIQSHLTNRSSWNTKDIFNRIIEKLTSQKVVRVSSRVAGTNAFAPFLEYKIQIPLPFGPVLKHIPPMLQCRLSQTRRIPTIRAMT